MTPAIIDFNRRKLDRIDAAWEARGRIDEGDIAFLIRMARCYLGRPTPPPATRSPRLRAGRTAVAGEILSAVLMLVDHLDDAERLTVLRRLRPLGPEIAVRGDVSSVVAEIIRPGETYRVDDIIVAVAAGHPDFTRKQIYNALGYLARHGGVRRLRYGYYCGLSRPASPSPTATRSDPDA